MDIGLALLRNIVIDNTRDRLDIKTPGGDIGGDKDLDVSRTKLIHDREPQILGLVSMQGTRAVAVTPEHAIKIDNLALGIAEDNRCIVRMTVEYSAKGVELLMRREGEIALRDIGDGREASRGRERLGSFM